jgi:hypothetical protein
MSDGNQSKKDVNVGCFLLQYYRTVPTRSSSPPTEIINDRDWVLMVGFFQRRQEKWNQNSILGLFRRISEGGSLEETSSALCRAAANNAFCGFLASTWHQKFSRYPW